jgi:ankyrin repeat protein
VHGRTPLHLAVSRPEPCRLTIRALLETDPAAAKSAVDRNGQTPMDYAKRHPDLSVCELMHQHITTEPVAAVAKPAISAQTW